MSNMSDHPIADKTIWPTRKGGRVEEDEVDGRAALGVTGIGAIETNDEPNMNLLHIGNQEPNNTDTLHATGTDVASMQDVEFKGGNVGDEPSPLSPPIEGATDPNSMQDVPAGTDPLSFGGPPMHPMPAPHHFYYPPPPPHGGDPGTLGGYPYGGAPPTGYPPHSYYMPPPPPYHQGGYAYPPPPHEYYDEGENFA
jgi:hypothetical protein